MDLEAKIEEALNRDEIKRIRKRVKQTEKDAEKALKRVTTARRKRRQRRHQRRSDEATALIGALQRRLGELESRIEQGRKKR